MFPLPNPAGITVVPGNLQARGGVRVTAGGALQFDRPDCTFYFKNTYGVNDTLLRWNYNGGATLMSLSSTGLLNAASISSTDWTAHGVVIGQGASAAVVAAPSTAGYVLASNGSSADPSFQATASAGLTTKIAQVICSGSQATVVFSSIPATYTNLLIVCKGRDTTAGTSDSNIFLYMNTDQTAANYKGSEAMNLTALTVAGAQPSSSTNGGVATTFPNNGASAGRAGISQILIPSYADTVFNKQIISETYDVLGTGSGETIVIRAFEWASTAAINKLTFTAGTAFLDGTTFTLYGLA